MPSPETDTGTVSFLQVGHPQSSCVVAIVKMVTKDALKDHDNITSILKSSLPAKKRLMNKFVHQTKFMMETVVCYCLPSE